LNQIIESIKKEGEWKSLKNINLENELKEVKEKGNFKMKKSEVKKIFENEMILSQQKISKLEDFNKILKKQSDEVGHMRHLNDTLMAENLRLKIEIEKINEKLAMTEMESQIKKKRIDEFNEYFVLKDMTINNMTKFNKTQSDKQGWKI